MSVQTVDIAIAGGGLAGSLTAYRLTQVRPDLKIALVEQGASLGGNHTWSFHQTDLSPRQYDWIRPFVTHRWPRQEISFPQRNRVLDVGYNSISSEQLARIAGDALGDSIRTDSVIAELDPTGIVLADGQRIEAACVIDARGQTRTPELALGFQKFVGHEIATSTPHGVAHPMIMDATVPQEDGYRFVYLLPFEDSRLLVEDTYYTDGPELDDDAVDRRIESYVRDKGWTDPKVVRRERGVLPIALGGDIDAFWRSRPRDIVQIGMRAALFHPTTGYSLPDAVATADLIAGSNPLTGPAVAEAIRQHSIAKWNERRFFRLLNRMLYHAAEPHERYVVMQRFYGLSQNLVARFYADRLTLGDQARILIGKPPVSIKRAVRSLPPSSAWRNAPAETPDPAYIRK